MAPDLPEEPTAPTMDELTNEFFTEVMGILADIDSDGEMLCPRRNLDGSVHLLVNCGDLFYWATADAEPLEIEDLPVLRQCLTDLQAADPMDGDCYLWELYCCRKRGMRPQWPFGRTYDRAIEGYANDRIPRSVRALFDALGPEGSDRDRG
jgi:hypothetical protein